MLSNSPRAGCAAIAALALAPAALGQSAPLITTGDSLPGLGAVIKVDHVAINDDGHWIAQVRTASGAVAIVRDGVVILKTGDPLGTPGQPFSLSTSQSLNSALENVLPVGSGVYFGTTELLSTASPVPGFSAAAKFTKFGDAKLNDDRQVLASVTIMDPNTTFFTDDAMVLIQTDAAGTVLSQSYLVQEGDDIPGLTGTVRDVAETRRGFDLANSGDTIFQVLTYGTESAVLVNGAVAAKSGGPSPVFGSSYVSIFDSAAIGAGGDYAFLATYAGGLGLVWNGAEVARTNQPMPSMTSFDLESFGARFLDVDANGRVLWFADWSDPDDTRDTGIMRDHELVVQEGVSLAGDQVIEELSTDFSISSNGRYLTYTAVRTDGVQGAFLLDLQGGVTPYFGCAPNGATLSLSGTAVPGGSIGGLMQQPQSDDATGFLVFSMSPATAIGSCGIPVPGIGEVLIGSPVLTVPTSQVVPGIGAFVSLPLPSGLGLLGATVFTQGAFLDLAGTTPSEPVRLTDGAQISIGL